MTPAELRDLDAQIHREVMGRSCHVEQGRWVDDVFQRDCGETIWHPVPWYHEDIASAWLVIERLKTHFRRSIRFSNKQVDWCWWVYVYAIDGDDEVDVVVQEQSAPLAICLAALKSVRGKP